MKLNTGQKFCLRAKNVIPRGQCYFPKTQICQAIESAIQSKVFDLIVIPSDSKEILKICSKYKSVYLHNRSRKLSEDNIGVSIDINYYKDYKMLKKNFE